MPRLTRGDWAWIAAISLVVIGARLIPGARTIDDAYITFRYSRDIVEGVGFVYNAGQHLLGTTTPLYTLLMAFIGWIMRGGDYPNYALVVNTLADVGTALLLGYLVRRITGNRWLGLFLGVLFAVAPASVTFAIGGMETSLAIFLMVSAATLYAINTDNKRWWSIAFGVCLTLGFLTRIDAALWIGPLLLYQLIERIRRRQSPPWATWISAGLSLLPWLIFSVAYFGSPVANTISAKLVAYRLPSGLAALELFHWYATPFSEPGILGAVGSEIAFILYVPLIIIATLAITRTLPRLLPLLLYPWLYALVFGLANPLMFRWYFWPPIPVLFFLLVCGLWALVDAVQRGLLRATRRSEHRARLSVFSPLIYGVIGLLWFVSSLNMWTLHPDHGPDRPAPQMAYIKLEINYAQVADELLSKYGVRPDTLVASADVGTIGYYSRATILDTVGLVSAGLAHYYPLDPSQFGPDEVYAVPPQMILDAKPPFFISMEGYISRSVEVNPDFLAQYKLVDFIPIGVFGSGMQLYQRQVSP